MQRYDSYKDSGIQWLGEIPSHWRSMSLLYTLRSKICDGPHETPNYVENGVPFISIDSLNESANIDFSNVRRFISEEDYQRYCTKTVIEQGDILFSKAATIGKTAIVGKEKFMVWSPLAVLKPSSSYIKNKYLYHILCNKKVIEAVSISGSESTQINVGMRELEKVRIPVPPLPEQQAIASYLDTATVKIDEAIAQQQKMIDLLNERKQIIINNAVTKGLNPNAKMKPSGIDWIGNIREDWKLYKLKHLLQTGLMYGANESAESEETSFPRYIRITDIDENGNLRPDTFRSLHPKKAEPYLLAEGDILFARSGATAGKTFLFDQDIKACFAGYLIKAKVSKSLLPRYLMYYTRSGIYDQWRNGIFIQATIQNIGADKYANLPIPLPKVEEQQNIVDFLDVETGKIDCVISAASKQITLLQERKQIIINDVVTGKVKVC